MLRTYPRPWKEIWWFKAVTFGDIQMWAGLREKVPNILSHCHTKRRIGARATPILLLVWHRLLSFFFEKSVSYQLRFRPLGTIEATSCFHSDWYPLSLLIAPVAKPVPFIHEYLSFLLQTCNPWLTQSPHFGAVSHTMRWMRELERPSMHHNLHWLWMDLQTPRMLSDSV